MNSIARINIDESNSYKFSTDQTYSIILDCYLRKYGIIDQNNVLFEFSNSTCLELHEILDIPLEVIERGLECFRARLINLNQKIRDKNWEPNKVLRVKTLVDGLNRLFKLAPIFDIFRACHNAKILQDILDVINSFPKFSTQKALILYVTDLKSDKELKIIQKNIRILTNCSAYAFHKNRNLIEKRFPHIFEQNLIENKS